MKSQINETNVSMLIDTGATKFFLMPTGANILKIEVENTALSVKVNYAQRFCLAAQVVRGERFKAGEAKFEENFTICKLGGVDVLLENTFLHYYRVEVRQRSAFT